MLRAISLGFLTGLLAANALPHFLRGITAQEYPNLTGNSPVRNVVGGWVLLVVSGLLGYLSGVDRHPVPALVALAVGVLVMAVFHARGGAFGMNRRFGRPNPEL